MTDPSKGGSSDDFIVFGAPQIQQAEIDEMVATLQSGWLGTGPKVKKFEDAVCAYKKAKYAAAVNSCTAGMHLSMIAAGIKSGDEVITTALTFCATVNVILHAGATPVLADVDSRTMNIDPADVERKITSKTKAILPVHFAGMPCDMDALCDIAKKHNLVMVEDCAHAIETEWRGQKAGTFGDFGVLSFYVTKNVVTGEGGMVLAKNQEHINHIKVLALHGMSKDAWARYSDSGYKHYFVVDLGFKYNLTDMAASIGLHHLARIEENWKRRQAIVERYNEALKDLPITLPPSPEPHMRHGHHLYTILVEEPTAGIARDNFIGEMTKRKIGVGVHFLSITEHPYYQQRFGWDPDMCPHAKRIGRSTVSLPLSAKLTDAEVERVIDAVRDVLA